MNPPDALIAFCKLLEGDKNLQSQVKAAKHPQQIIEIATATGHEITTNELRYWSKELRAPYFPWSQMGNTWRRNFFE